MSIRLAPNLPMPTLPPDLAAAWDIHEGHRFHAIHIAPLCYRGVAWTKDELKSGAWLKHLRAHRCGT